MSVTKPAPDERLLTDPLRIEALITTHLRAVVTTSDGWDRLYLDPDDGRLWELTYPHGEMHGGGPPELREIDVTAARDRYGYGLSNP